MSLEDVENTIEDIFALAKVFYKLEKYQVCCKSKIKNKILFHQFFE
jgi:hypothetical protein